MEVCEKKDKDNDPKVVSKLTRLKDELNVRGLRISGNKPVLIARLLKVIEGKIM